MEAIREKVLEHNHMELTGPATGQVVYSWERPIIDNINSAPSVPAVLFLVKQDDRELANVAAQTIRQLVTRGVQVLVDDSLSRQLEEFTDVDLGSDMIRLFQPKVSRTHINIHQITLDILCTALTNDTFFSI
jgi:hypothetical protein